MSIQAYPLQWPAGWPRTERREPGSQFRTTLPAALNSLTDEVRRLGAKNLVLSSNYTLGAHNPTDPGVVAYFELRGQKLAIPCDRWARIEHNVRAIALTIEAMRGMERWGAKHMITAMFQGFKALPGRSGSKSWRDVLGFNSTSHPTSAEIMQRFRELSKKCHPDAGGSHDLMAELNRAKDEALAVLNS